MKLDNIAIKHWIRFEYDVSNSLAFDSPHFIFSIEDSIIYKALVSNNFEDYNKLILTTNQSEHSESKFVKLKDTFEVDLLEHPDHQIKLYWHPKVQKYIIKDGCHRLALIKFFNLDKDGEIPQKWLSLENELQ